MPKTKAEISRRQWNRMQNDKDCAEHALIEFHDHSENASCETPFETGTLIDLLVGLRHLCDLKTDMNFELAVRTSAIEYHKEKVKFSYPGQPACADLKADGV